VNKVSVHTGTGREKKPNGEVRQVSYGRDAEVREMRIAETILNIIQDRGKRKLPLDDVYRQLFNPDMYLRAYAKLYKNEGAMTPGITEETVDGMSQQKIAKIIEAIRYERWRWTPVQRVEIPKSHGKPRPLGIPTWSDKMVQEVIRSILEAYYEPQFSKHSHGFRPKRGCHTALTDIRNVWVGTKWFIEGDIKGCFDTIPHQRLMKVVQRRVADRNIQDMIWKFLRAGVMYRNTLSETLTGTPQGGIVSPLLANLYLDQLDKYMESISLNLTYAQRQWRRKKGKGNYLYVRYADDFVVLCNGTKAETLAMKEELKELLSTWGLTLSEDKTKVTHITEGFRFLGYQVRREMGGNGKVVPKVLIPEEAMKRFEQKMRRIFAPGTRNDSIRAKISAANRVIRGWCHYYQATSSPHAPFRRVRDEVFRGMAHWLGRKFKLSMPQVMRKYEKDNTFWYKSSTLVMPTDFKAKRLRQKTWHNPYTAQETIAREELFTWDDIWDGNESRHGMMDLREEVIQLKGTICVLNLPDICESNGNPLHPSEVEIHHDPARKRFKVKTEADRMKHLHPVCTSCHRAKTKSDRKVLSRVR